MPLAICSNCRHYRMRPQAVLFDQYELQSPGILQAKLKWEQEQREQRLNEQRGYSTENPYFFDYEPFFYPWCAAFTPYDPRLHEILDEATGYENSESMREVIRKSVELGHSLMEQAAQGNQTAAEELVMANRASVNPRTGEVKPFYALCDRMNPEGQCINFEPKKAS